MLTVLADVRFRAAVAPDLRESLRASGPELAERSQRAAWVGQLASVLDDEPLTVLDPASGNGYALTMSGIGDNGLFGMANGRVFRHMPPSLTLDRVLPREEAAALLARVRPAVEDDLMADR